MAGKTTIYLVACALGVLTASGQEYRALFRAGTAVVRDSAEEANFWKAVDAHPGAFDEVSFFSQHNHSVRPLSFHRENARQAAAFFAKARARGMKPGINVLTTLGFFADQVSAEMNDFPPAVNGGGGPCAGRLCPTAPRNHAYIHELYTLYAKCGPSFIYIDDDVCGAAGDCYCTNCMALFAQGHPGILKDGTRAELRGLLECEDWHVRRRAREAWLKFCEDRVDAVCALAEKAVHAVDPAIAMGYMMYTAGSGSLACGRWAATLAGPGRAGVYWRPGGGHWTEDSFMDLVSKTLRMTVQMHGLPSDAVVLGEIENWPYALRKSPDHMGFEALHYLGAGMTGAAFNFASLVSLHQPEFEPFYARAAAVRDAGRKIVAAMGNAPRTGIAFAWNDGSAVDMANRGWGNGRDMPLPANLSSIGFPVATDPARAQVRLLDASLAAELTEVALTNILSGGVMLDTGALQVLNDRGFASWTGFRRVHDTPHDVVTRYLEHPFTLRAGLWRDVRSAFGWHGAFTCIERTQPGAAYTEEAIDLDGKGLGFAGGVFENAQGGRVAVGAMLPFDWSEQFARAHYLRNLFRWLSRDGLPAYFNSFHRAAVFATDTGVFVSNLAVGRMTGAEIAVRGEGPRTATVFEGGVQVSESTLEPVRREGVYGIYALPALPVNGEVLLR